MNATGRVLRTGGLKFDGVDDYVRVEDRLSLQLADALTFAAWVKSNITDYGDVWLHVARKYPQLFLVARFNNFFGSIIFDAAGRSYYLGFALGLDMGWHHYVLTYDRSLPSGNLKRYLDGVLIGQATATVGLASTAGSPLYLGGTGTAGLNGLIDEVRVYSRALSQAEISDIYSRNAFIKDGLVLYLPMTEYEGSILYDRSGYGNNGNIYGAEWVIKKARRVLPV
jgi:sialidase-1